MPLHAWFLYLTYYCVNHVMVDITYYLVTLVSNKRDALIVYRSVLHLMYYLHVMNFMDHLKGCLKVRGNIWTVPPSSLATGPSTREKQKE
jgi:hypothetical protein